MRAVIQRVKEASVTVNGEQVSRIGPGLLTLLGVAKGDDEAKLQALLRKIIELRIFEDEQGKMNLSLLDIKGEHLLVSQFTLLGDLSRGRRPSFHLSEEPQKARDLYEKALQLSAEQVPTQGGLFAADMKISLINDGPVTFVLDL